MDARSGASAPPGNPARKLFDKFTKDPKPTFENIRQCERFVSAMATYEGRRALAWRLQALKEHGMARLHQIMEFAVSEAVSRTTVDHAVRLVVVTMLRALLRTGTIEAQHTADRALIEILLEVRCCQLLARRIEATYSPSTCYTLQTLCR